MYTKAKTIYFLYSRIKSFRIIVTKTESENLTNNQRPAYLLETVRDTI